MNAHQSTRPIILHATEEDGSPESDCACPDDGFAVETSAPPVFQELTRYRKPSGVFETTLRDGYGVAFNPLAGSGVVVLNMPARQMLTGFETARTPAEVIASLPEIAPDDGKQAVEQLVQLRLLQPDSTSFILIRSKPHTLTAWLHVTNACNLRCPYCYLHKTDDAMTEETGRAAIDAVFRSAVLNDFRAVKLKYAGGEAILNFPLVVRLHKYACDLAKGHKLLLKAVVLSNGVALSPKMIEALQKHDIRLMISLDGVGEYHDAQRIFANGRGSFALVARSIEHARRMGLTPDICITITNRNVDGLAEAVRFVLERGLPFSINFYRENDCSASTQDLTFSEQRIIQAVQRAFQVIEEFLPNRSLVASLVDQAHFDRPHECTCGVGHSYLVINQHGRVANCQMEIERTITDVYAEDPLAVIQADRMGIQNLPVDEKEDCRDCTWRYWCTGGCPVLAYRMTGRYDIRSPSCRIYKALYPEILRLEGLRLLKWELPIAA